MTNRHHTIKYLLLACTLLFIGVCRADSYKNAVASAHPLATDAGLQILEQGGNAFDAAVTVAAVLAVVEPYSSGIGGGGFWLLHRAADNKRVMLDGRERAPLAAHRDMYLDANGNVIAGLSINGALAAGIPGQVAAMTHLQRNYGSMSLAKLLRPAIELAEKGFAVDKVYSRLATLRLPVLQQYPSTADVFLQNNKVPADGAIIRQTALATTLRHIAKHGNDGFYRGDVAEKLVQGVRQAGGIWTLKDLQEYRVVERQPLIFKWRGATITTADLPSSGGVTLAQMLNMLEALAWRNTPSGDSAHLLIEVMRRAYRERAAYLGDSDHINVDTERLAGAARARTLARDINANKATPSASLPPVPTKISGGDDTTHYSILDAAGNRVAATLSINYPFGSGYVAPGTGVLLNDEMDDFSLLPGEPNVYGLVGNEANAIAPGKRMLSSMSPTFVDTDKRLAIVGTPGGSRIISMVLQAILSFHAGAPAEAIAAKARFHHQYLPDKVQLEPGALSEKNRQQLIQQGHELQQLDDQYGNMQIIIYDKANAVTQAASDPRGIGSARVADADNTSIEK